MSADQGKVDKAVAAYQKKFGRLPKDMETLVAYTSQKEPGVPKLTKKKHGELITETLESCKQAAGKKKKGGKGKKGAAAAAAPAEEETPTEETTPKKKPPKQEYPIDTTILLSSDRIGIVRWFGLLPSRKGYFYGVEFLGSFVGNCDGAVDGVRYFQTAEDRAKFFPPSKIRKAASQKDMMKILGHERTQSWLARNSAAEMASAATAEPDLPVVDESGGADDAKDEDEDPPAEAGEEDAEEDEDEEEAEEKAEPVKPKKTRKTRSSTVVDQIDVEVVSVRENELEFILRQNDNTRELLLDIYCNPALSQLFIAAFEQVKTLEMKQQSKVWKDLISRWRLHL